MVTTFYPPWSFGGDAVFVRHLANALAQRGHEVDVVHSRAAFRALGGAAPASGVVDHPNVTVHGLESRASRLLALAMHQTGRPFPRSSIRALLDRDFDVIHYHNVSLLGGPAVLGYGRAIKLYTLHEYWLLCPTHLLFRFGRAPCDRRTCVTCSIAQLRPPQLWRRSGALEAALRHVDAVLSPSRFGIDVHRRFGVNAHFEHLPNFVPPSPEGGRDDPPAEPYFLYVGRLETAKGVQTLVSFFRDWRRAKLLVAGSGRDERRLRALVAGCDHIRFLGPVSADRLAPLYRGAVALVVPSLTYELFPLVILESFREGTPVVARNLGSLPEIIAESGGGVTYDDDAGLASALDRLLADRAWRDALGRRAATAQRTLWSDDAHVARYLRIIEQAGASRADATGGPVPCPA